MSLQELESAVTRLPSQELTQFAAWFEEFQSQAWDRQIEQDILAGPLDALAEEADRELEAGRCQTHEMEHSTTRQFWWLPKVLSVEGTIYRTRTLLSCMRWKVW